MVVKGCRGIDSSMYRYPEKKEQKKEKNHETDEVIEVFDDLLNLEIRKLRKGVSSGFS